METDHEIISTVILPIPLIQEGQLSITSKKYMHKVPGLSLPRKSVSRLMTTVFTICIRTDRPEQTV